MIVIEIISIVLTGITFIISIVSIIYSTAYKRAEFDKRVEKLEKDLDKILCDVTKLHDDMIRVHTIMQLKMQGLENVLSAKNSPRALNELGAKLYSEMKGDEFIQKNKDRLFSLIDSQKPKTAFDVEATALFVCNSLVSDDIFNPIKQFVYNCPIQKDAEGEDFELTLNGACFVLSLPLRNAYLEEHPEIK